jgi:predicted dehydrogenase
VEWDGLARSVTLAVDGEPPRIAASSQERNEMFATQARAFLDAHRQGHGARLATAEDGVRALAVCDAARRASAHRRQEPVDY